MVEKQLGQVAQIFTVKPLRAAVHFKHGQPFVAVDFVAGRVLHTERNTQTHELRTSRYMKNNGGVTHPELALAGVAQQLRLGFEEAEAKLAPVHDVQHAVQVVLLWERGKVPRLDAGAPQLNPIHVLDFCDLLVLPDGGFVHSFVVVWCVHKVDFVLRVGTVC